MEARLTEKQRRFVDAYLADGDEIRAAVRAGYAPRDARRTAARLMNASNVRRAISARRAGAKAGPDYVLAALMEIVELSLQREPAFTGKGERIVDDEGRPVWRFDGRTANKALELMGRYLGMFSDKDEPESAPDVRVVLFGES